MSYESADRTPHGVPPSVMQTMRRRAIRGHLRVAEPAPRAHSSAFAPVEDLQTVRQDALPEFTTYTDKGCDVFDACLTCPLVRCRYDQPGGKRKLLNAARDNQIRRRRGEGATLDELMAEFAISRRTVWRALAVVAR